jgi:adenylate cyclase
MAREIERKFLVASSIWREAVSYKVELRDGRLAYSNDRKVRVRFYDDRATLTVKGPRRGISREELVFDIPAADALVLLNEHCRTDILEKTRHYVPFGGFEWIMGFLLA